MVRADFPGEEPARLRQVRVEVVGVRDFLEGFGEELPFRVAGQGTQRRVDLKEAAVEVDQGHADCRVLERMAEALFAAAERLLGPFPGRDVDHRAAPRAHRAAFVADGHGHVVDPDGSPVLRQ